MWHKDRNYCNVGAMLGETLVSADIKDDEEIMFTMSSGRKFRMYHEQDCCEGVSIEDVCGNIEDLIGSPLVMSEEVSDYEGPKIESKWDDSYTWTFYKFATVKGYVTIRWFGSSNGYYSERVDFYEQL